MSGPGSLACPVTEDCDNQPTCLISLAAGLYMVRVLIREDSACHRSTPTLLMAVLWRLEVKTEHGLPGQRVRAYSQENRGSAGARPGEQKGRPCGGHGPSHPPGCIAPGLAGYLWFVTTMTTTQTAGQRHGPMADSCSQLEETIGLKGGQ